MKIAIASDDGKFIAKHFGRTQGFLIFQVAENKIISTQYLANTFTHHHQHHHDSNAQEHHHSHHEILNALNDCSVIISQGMGRRLLEDFTNHGKQVFITSETIAENAASQYLQGVLNHMPNKTCSH